MIKDFNNYTDITFTKEEGLPKLIIGCNFKNCTFEYAEITKFERCNIENSEFKTITSFDRSNVIDTITIEGSKWEKSNNIKTDEDEEENIEDENINNPE